MNEHFETAIGDLIGFTKRYPKTARSVQQNINEQYGNDRDATCMGWSIEMFCQARDQFAGLIEAGEAEATPLVDWLS